MSIYSSNTNSVNYRKIWSDCYGPIPKDEDNRSFEIHHIDGNRANNVIENLLCVSIKEHYEIHKSQGDFGACFSILLRMEISPEEKSQLSSIIQKERIAANNHPFCLPDFQKNNNLTAVKNKTHHWLKENGGSEKNREYRLKEIDSNTHIFCYMTKEYRQEIQNDRVRKGTHHLQDKNFHKTLLDEGRHGCQSQAFKDASKEANEKLLAEGIHQTQIIYTCPHCGKEGKGIVMFRYHFDKCKFKKE